MHSKFENPRACVRVRDVLVDRDNWVLTIKKMLKSSQRKRQSCHNFWKREYRDLQQKDYEFLQQIKKEEAARKIVSNQTNYKLESQMKNHTQETLRSPSPNNATRHKASHSLTSVLTKEEKEFVENQRRSSLDEVFALVEKKKATNGDICRSISSSKVPVRKKSSIEENLPAHSFSKKEGENISLSEGSLSLNNKVHPDLIQVMKIGGGSPRESDARRVSHRSPQWKMDDVINNSIPT
mmetsp:Transcript_1455/g.2068  ORF Transcript_1455/g.2068 Transcript_1455/m.2068 type:complete len:238 (+) Transcript_1455:702-1415(+)